MMKNKSRIFTTFLLIGGIGLIIAFFFIFLKEIQDVKLFYLNMIMTCVVYAIIFFRTFDIFGAVEDVAKTSSGYGLKWYGIYIYTPLTIGFIVISILFGLEFKYCLIIHSIFIFILLLFFFSGFIVKNNVNKVIHDIEVKKSSLQKVIEQIDLLEMQCILNQDNTYQEPIDLLKENIRFITSSDQHDAIALEEKLIEKLNIITNQIKNKSEPSNVINDEFNECMMIIRLRKNKY